MLSNNKVFATVGGLQLGSKHTLINSVTFGAGSIAGWGWAALAGITHTIFSLISTPGHPVIQIRGD